MYEVAIIGAGPAGLAAAIQLQRYGLSPLVFEQAQAGGLLRNANLVENYPGFPRGITGIDLVARFESQAVNVGVEIIYERVTGLDLDDGNFSLAATGGTYSVQTVVVASGTCSSPIPILVPKAVAERVLSEVWPLLGLKRKSIIIVGAGDAAFDYALSLSRRNRVMLLNRGTEVRCLDLLKERVFHASGIRYASDVRLKSVETSSGGSRLKVRCESGGVEDIIEADYLLYAIGRVPQLEFLSGTVKQAERRLVSSGRLFFIGDVRNGLYRQTAIAAGDGLRAAMTIFHSMRRIS